ncbi:hypothetical protein [Thaumasiovibrio sp. DFM-14]|uniref:hypothetical protein n=1 Tax=Thaumasiovibrio sp. DFM-14 TaxID=3384792 RepID=UPI0039A147B1
MRVETDTNLLFDEQHKDCLCIKSQANGYIFAFVQCLDLGQKQYRHKEPRIKRYWGLYDSNNPESSIRQILRNGGKWPELPKG